MLVLLQGALWGVAAWLFWGLGTPYHQRRADARRLQLLRRLGAAAGHAAARLPSASSALVLAPTIVRIASDTRSPTAPGSWRRIVTMPVRRHGADGAHPRHRAGPGDRG
ncbi:MAG: hypothetical protein MZW92_28255 [Comamonadaceae bacterium]|nr:hypothetical protein [Comamonadaceae bacterium]